MVKTESVYDPVEGTDGHRILVTRFWPRGISKARLSAAKREGCGRVSEQDSARNYDTLLPHSPQYLPLPSSTWSHTGHRRTQLPAPPFGLTSSISRTAMTVIAVPVRYSVRMPRAQSTAPCSASQLATSRMLPSRRIAPINPRTIAFRIVRLIIFSFHNRQWTSVQGSANLCRAQVLFRRRSCRLT